MKLSLSHPHSLSLSHSHTHLECSLNPETQLYSKSLFYTRSLFLKMAHIIHTLSKNPRTYSSQIQQEIHNWGQIDELQHSQDGIEGVQEPTVWRMEVENSIENSACQPKLKYKTSIESRISVDSQRSRGDSQTSLEAEPVIPDQRWKIDDASLINIESGSEITIEELSNIFGHSEAHLMVVTLAYFSKILQLDSEVLEEASVASKFALSCWFTSKLAEQSSGIAGMGDACEVFGLSQPTLNHLEEQVITHPDFSFQLTKQLLDTIRTSLLE